MRPEDAAAPSPVRLSAYRPPAWEARTVRLEFDLAPSGARVRAKIRFEKGEGGPLRLDGELLRLLSASVDGRDVMPEGQVDAEGLTLAAVGGAPLPDAFDWEAEVEIDPEANTALEGLYLSNGVYCTQCEAEGFRKITFYPDRPDVMAPFTVRIEGDLPVLLSNGNPTAQGDGWAEWHDPWPKPAYLFALVAGELVAHSDSFTTASGRAVDLNVWVRPGDEGKCAYAMDALKRSMRWDEEVYGREYDLDVFNIVAVDDFNMGAMENKGLNIFNSKYVLASPETATDRDYEFIESIVAHEYFHNWTGNRITCRDWFQLCLKEGLTVFRDQQFSGDQRSHAVKRIDDVLGLRGRQFREDTGPLAHPVRPASFVEINNFYTATVYEKGAEVIGMLKTLVGDDGYAKALDLYFERHDGDAATIEDWLTVFEDATGRDLSQFARWYSQAGTPRLAVEEAFDAGTYTLTFRQETAPTPGQPEKLPQVLPIAVGLLNPNGDEVLPTTVLEMTEAFTVPADGPDLFQYFVIPVDVPEDRLVAAIEFLPGNERVVHHCVLFLDGSGEARRRDAATPEPGYAGFGGPGFTPSGARGGGSVGNTPRRLPGKMGRYLAKGSDLVMQIHYHPTGKVEVDRSRVGLYFVDEPVAEVLAQPARLVGSIWAANYEMDIPAGAADYRRSASYTLPRDVVLVGVVAVVAVVGAIRGPLAEAAQ